MKKNLLLIFAVLCVSANAQFTKLLDFAGATNGRSPYGSLITDGTFMYGMTKIGGASNLGTVFKIKPDGSGYVRLLSFTGAANGSNPYGSLIYDGNYLYGMTFGGGASGAGVVFKIKPDGTGYVKLLDFTGTANGDSPTGSLISDGTYLYGLVGNGGGSANCSGGCGSMFKIKPDGTGYVKLLDFTGVTNGDTPSGSLVSDGTFLYGMTYLGGANNNGTIFKIKPDASGYVKLLDLNDVVTGKLPNGSLMLSGGFLYGMTASGGANGYGTVFKIKTDATGFAKLLDFDDVTNGRTPYGTLIAVGSNLCGMTWLGGANSMGTIFTIKNNGTGYTKLLDFAGITSGANPQGDLLFYGTALYGLTSFGGVNNMGTYFKFATTLGVDELANENLISISPNPFADEIKINNSNGKEGEVTLYDVAGKEILRQKTFSGETKLNTEKISAGFYLLNYIEGERKQNLKVAKY
jgi:uncharacterized repeat protein (TIGR03803 family)